jgi:hypothetical protein
MGFVTTAAAIAAWLVVPEARCTLKLHVPDGQCRGAGEGPQKVRVDTVVIKTYLPAPQPPPAPPPPEPRVPPSGALPVQMVRLLTEADLERKSDWELTIMRNEIFARHGRAFNRPDLRSYFGQFDWYHPNFGPEEFDNHHQGLLTGVQQSNAEFILRYQRSMR